MELKQGAILAGLYGFKDDGRNMAFSSRGPGSYSLTRAQNKFCGLRRRFSRAFGVIAFLCAETCMSGLAQEKTATRFGAMFHVKHHPGMPHLVPFSMRA